MEEPLFGDGSEEFTEYMGAEGATLSPYFDFRDTDYLCFACRDLVAQKNLSKGLYEHVKIYGEKRTIKWLLHNNDMRWTLSVFAPRCDDRFSLIYDESTPTRDCVEESEGLLHMVLENYPNIAMVLNYTARELPTLLGQDFQYWACVRVREHDWIPLTLKDALDMGIVEPLTLHEEKGLICNIVSPLVSVLRERGVITPREGLRARSAKAACPRYHNPKITRPAPLPFFKHVHEPINGEDVDLELLLSMTYALVISGQFDNLHPKLPQTVPLMHNTIGRGVVRGRIQLDKDIDQIKLCKAVFGDATPGGVAFDFKFQRVLWWPRGCKINQLVPKPRIRLAPILAKLRKDILRGSEISSEPTEEPPASPIPKPYSGSDIPQGPQTYTGSDLERETLFMPSYCPLGSPVPFEDDKPEFNLRQYEMAEHMYPETVDTLPDPSISPSAERRREKWREEYLQNNRVTGESPLRVATRVDLEERMSAAEPQAAINNFSTQDELDSLNERALLSRYQLDSRNEEAILNEQLDESVLEEEELNGNAGNDESGVENFYGEEAPDILNDRFNEWEYNDQLE